MAREMALGMALTFRITRVLRLLRLRRQRREVGKAKLQRLLACLERCISKTTIPNDV